MNWLKRIFGSEKQVGKGDSSQIHAKELFPNLSLNEKRKVLDMNTFYLQSVLSSRKGQVQVVNVDMDADFVNKMTDDEILEAIELARLSQKATDASDHKEAIRIFEQIIAKAPFDSVSMMSIGVRYANLGDGRKAVQYLEKALQSDPNNQRIRNNLNGIRQHFRL